MHFKRIKELREDSDKTQKDIADALGCHIDVYRRYENGQRKIPVNILIALCKFYNVSSDYILELSDSPKR